MPDRIEVRPVEIPMATAFSHSSGRRTGTASVLVALDVDGVRGWGEGAPRPYVTGETVGTAVDALTAVDPRILAGLLDLGDFAAAMRALARTDVARLLDPARRMPAAAAALETALFDLVCRLHGRPGLDGLRHAPEAADVLRGDPCPTAVSFVVDLSRDVPAALARLDEATVRAIRHVKLKATADVDDCVRRVAQTRQRFGPDTGISVDVNGDWDHQRAVRAARLLREFDVAWLEEPVAPRDWAAMRDIRHGTGMAVMLDESCTGPEDLELAHRAGAVDHVNARISKAGGLFPTVALIAAAARRGVGAQLGVHVGEVGPLWGAARLLSCTVRHLVTVEAGKQDEWFPVPLTDPPYHVDRVHYRADPLGGVGIGLTPNETLLRQCPPVPASAGRHG